MNKIAVVVAMCVCLVAAASWAVDNEMNGKNEVSAPGATGAVDAKDMVTIMGAISHKTEDVNGTEMEVPYIRVQDAKTADGQTKVALIGKQLKIAGGAMGNAKAMDGKDVVIKGSVTDDEVIEASSITPTKEEKEEAEKAEAETAEEPANGNGAMDKMKEKMEGAVDKVTPSDADDGTAGAEPRNNQ